MCVGLPGRRSIGPGLIFLLLFASRQKVNEILNSMPINFTKIHRDIFYVLSFACAKERTKEKHTGNDIQPLPSR
jgi:hypothetical protein